MKLRFLYCFVGLFYFTNAQIDTVLYNDFSIQAIEIIDSSTAYFKLDLTNELNVDSLGWKTRSDMRPLSNSIIETMEDYIWFDDQIWRNWHVIPYLESIDTIIEDDIVTYDTINNIGIRSFSWFENPNRSASVLMTPPIYMNDNNGQLFWKSKPMQGPRHQDGYKVYVLEGSLNDPDNVPFQTLDYAFAMKELNVTNSSPLKMITSLAVLERDFGFVPEDGSDHTEYTLPDANELGEIDSTRQQPFMQEFNLDLAQYSGFIQIAFVHDSYDNNAIVLDDILITGNGNVGVKEIYSDKLKIFPNPAVNELYIGFRDDWKKPEIQIFDINGRLVNNQFVNNMTPVNVAELQPGQYLAKLKTEDEIYVQSFIKVK